MLFSLSYGVLHALGPGHGKVVIVTYLATHPVRLKSSLKLTFAASLVQGLVAIALVTLMLGVLQLFFPTIALQQLLAGKRQLYSGDVVRRTAELACIETPVLCP